MMVMLDIALFANGIALLIFGLMDIAGAFGDGQILMLPHHHRLHTGGALCVGEFFAIFPATNFDGGAEFFDDFGG